MSFTLPKCNRASRWSVLIDTNDTGDEGTGNSDVDAGFPIAERSLAVLLLEGDVCRSNFEERVWG